MRKIEDMISETANDWLRSLKEESFVKTLAAALLAEYGQIDTLLDRNRRAGELLREIHNSGVEMQDDRIDYMTIQVNKDTMKDIARWLEEGKP